jgi:hypothetical protein
LPLGRDLLADGLDHPISAELLHQGHISRLVDQRSYSRQG